MRGAEVNVSRGARLQAVAKLQRETAFQDPLPIAWEPSQEALEGNLLLEALGRQAGA